MKEFLKKLLKKTPLFLPIYAAHYRIFHYFCIPRWEKAGKPLPPPYPIKQAMLRDCAKKYGLKIFVETGTCRGDTIYALRRDFETIYSIELCDEFYRFVVKRFKRFSNLKLILGDSATQIENVLKLTQVSSQPILFWLDGHYSGADTAKGEVITPIFQELTHILNAPQTMTSVIAIDDAGEFGSSSDYPSLEELTEFVLNIRKNVKIVVNMDIIWIFPSN